MSHRKYLQTILHILEKDLISYLVSYFYFHNLTPKLSVKPLCGHTSFSLICCRLHSVILLAAGKVESRLSQTISGKVKNCRKEGSEITLRKWNFYGAKSFFLIFDFKGLSKFHTPVSSTHKGHSFSAPKNASVLHKRFKSHMAALPPCRQRGN